MTERRRLRFPGRLVMLGNFITWMRNRKMEPHRLTASQSDVIMFILINHGRRSVTAADIMVHYGLSQSTVAGIIARLEAKELIYRTIDPADNRRSIICPTDKGLELDCVLRENAHATEDILIEGMTDEEALEFSRLLQIALDNVRKYRKGGTKSE